MRIYILFFALALGICSCSAPKDLVYKDVQHFGIGKGATGNTVVSMNVELYNPNHYRMKLKRTDLDLFINNNRVGKINLAHKLAIPRLDTFSMPVTLDVDLKQILPNAVQLLLNSEVAVHLVGSVKAGRHGMFITIPVDYTGKQDIRESIKW
jgi:LEA14-like dessication related protein